MMPSRSPVLHVRNLRVADANGTERLQRVHFELFRNEVLALVGDTEAGKTTTGLACLGYYRNGLHYVSGSMMLNPVDGTEPFDLVDLDAETMRSLRGRRIAYVPPNPQTALNPAMRVVEHIAEVLAAHNVGATDADRRARVARVLIHAGLPDDAAFQQRWPHELTGDQPHRLTLAMAFVLDPDVVIFDEPADGLDMLARHRVLETIRQMTVTHNVAGLYLTHDPAIAASIGDRVAVMHQGEIVETMTPDKALSEPDHPVTRTLFATAPEPTADTVAVGVPTAQPDGGVGAALLAIQALSVSYQKHQVLRGINLNGAPGECTFIFGETGAGKTTLAQTIAGLVPRYQGTITLRGQPLAGRIRRRSPEQRQAIQYLFDSAIDALHPRRAIGQSLSVPLENAGSAPVDQHQRLVEQALETVGLDTRFTDRYPGDLSAEQLQRAAIARALVARPSVLVCDDITAELDVTAQASIIALLNSLRQTHGLTILFLASDLRWARHIATRIAVLHHGQIVEHGTVDDVLTNPGHEYTQALLAHTPGLHPGVRRG